MLQTFKVVIQWLWSVRPQTRSKIILWVSSLAAMALAIFKLDLSEYGQFIRLDLGKVECSDSKSD